MGSGLNGDVCPRLSQQSERLPAAVSAHAERRPGATPFGPDEDRWQMCRVLTSLALGGEHKHRRLYILDAMNTLTFLMLIRSASAVKSEITNESSVH